MINPKLEIESNYCVKINILKLILQGALGKSA